MNKQLYEYNMKVLADNLNTPDEFEYEVETARNGSKTIKITINGQERYIHSKYDPDKEAEKEVSQLVIEKLDFCIMFGLGMGYHARKILRKMGSTNNLIIVEPCKTFLKAFTQNPDNKDILSDKRVMFTTFNDANSFLTQLSRFVNYLNYQTFKCFILPIYKDLFKEQIDEFFKALNAHANLELINRNTVIALAKKWQLNVFKNIKHMLKSYPINDLAGMFTNKPAVIVSGGPSLDKNIEVLKEAEGKIVILATDTVVNVLAKHNIKPSLVFNVDPLDAAAAKIKVRFDDTPLVCLPVSTYKMLDNHKGRKIVSLSSDQFLISQLNKMDKHTDSLPVGGSVATLTFETALYMKSNPVIFIGQDLAFTDNKTHAAGATEAKELQSIEGLIPIKDVYGDTVYTDKTFISFKNWFESQISINKEKYDFIDATEGGAYIEGTRVMTLKEVVDKYCTEDIAPDQTIQKALESNPLLDDNEQEILLDSYKQLEDNLKSTDELLEGIINNSEEMKKILDPKKAFSQKTYNRVNKELAKAGKKLEGTKNNLSELYRIVFEEVIAQIATYKYETIKDDKERNIKSMSNNIKLYSFLREAIAYTLPLLDEELENLDKKQEGTTAEEVNQEDNTEKQ